MTCLFMIDYRYRFIDKESKKKRYECINFGDMKQSLNESFSRHKRNLMYKHLLYILLLINEEMKIFMSDQIFLPWNRCKSFRQQREPQDDRHGFWGWPSQVFVLIGTVSWCLNDMKTRVGEQSIKLVKIHALTIILAIEDDSDLVGRYKIVFTILGMVYFHHLSWHAA